MIFINEEAMGTQSWLDHALDCKYISETQFATLDASWQSIGGMLNNMMNRADDFCKLAPADDQRKSSSIH